MPIDFRQKVDAAQQIVFNGESMGATFESDPINMLHFKTFFAQFVFTGTPAGTFDVYYSGDITNYYSKVTAPTYADVTRWELDDDASVVIAAAGSITYNHKEVSCAFVKFVYTRSSSTGSMYGTITKKG